jgi:hypothetical protein
MPNMRDVAREAHAALNRCKRKGVSAQAFASDDGNGRRGWSVCLLHYGDSGKHYGEIGNYEEYWGNSRIFLGEDGVLYVHDFRGQQIGPGRGGSGQAELSNRVRKASVDELRRPLLVLKTTRPYLMAVLEGLQSLGR